MCGHVDGEQIEMLESTKEMWLMNTVIERRNKQVCVRVCVSTMQ